MHGSTIQSVDAYVENTASWMNGSAQIIHAKKKILILCFWLVLRVLLDLFNEENWINSSIKSHKMKPVNLGWIPQWLVLCAC